MFPHDQVVLIFAVVEMESVKFEAKLVSATLDSLGQIVLKVNKIYQSLTKSPTI